MQAPCKDCPDRKVGCHSICEKYIAFDQYRKWILAEKAKENKENDDLWRASRNSKRRR